MHGFVHLMLKQFVISVAGEEGWTNILKEAGLKPRVYSSTGHYPDEEVVAIAVTGSKALNLPLETVLELFGEFLAPKLLESFSNLVNPSWGMFDFLEQTEKNIHEIIRSRDPEASPPKLSTQAIGPGKLHLFYDSPRGLLPVAKGIVKALSTHFKTPVEISELPGKTGLAITKI